MHACDRFNISPQVLLRALRDFNLGKLTADDEGIFLGLLNDLFPKTAELVPRAIYHAFEAKVQLISSYGLDVMLLVALLPSQHQPFLAHPSSFLTTKTEAIAVCEMDARPQSYTS